MVDNKGFYTDQYSKTILEEVQKILLVKGIKSNFGNCSVCLQPMVHHEDVDKLYINFRDAYIVIYIQLSNATLNIQVFQHKYSNLANRCDGKIVVDISKENFIEIVVKIVYEYHKQFKPGIIDRIFDMFILRRNNEQ